MIRVSIMYPNQAGKKFNWDYYLKKHIPAVHQKLDGVGLARTEVDKGIGSAQPGAPAPYLAVGYLYFTCVEDMQKCLVHAAEMMADVPNFTDIQPQVQISELL